LSELREQKKRLLCRNLSQQAGGKFESTFEPIAFAETPITGAADMPFAGMSYSNGMSA
jgi:hypothetical protein